MRLQREDKAVHTTETKLSPEAQAEYDRQTAGISGRWITGPEQNEVGRRVAVAAEQASQSPSWREFMDKSRAAAAPTTEEAAELAAVEAECQRLTDATYIARQVAMDAERYVRNLARAGHMTAMDPESQRLLARSRAEVTEAERVLERAIDAQRVVESQLGRTRGAIAQAGAWRQRRLIAGRI